MKNVYKSAGILMLVCMFFSCEEDEYFTLDSLVGKWELVALVNVESEHKYLNTVLEFVSDTTYTNSESNGSTIVSGSCIVMESIDSLSLSRGMFEGSTVDYKFLESDGQTLVLGRSVIPDTAVIQLQYHYIRLDD